MYLSETAKCGKGKTKENVTNRKIDVVEFISLVRKDL